MHAWRYTIPSPSAAPPKFLVADVGTPEEQRFVFYETVEIGRDEPHRSTTPGQLLVTGTTVSFRHCVISQRSDGRCFVRDLSRNGTRLNGRRLVPNVETELTIGQVLEITPAHRLALTGEQPVPSTEDMEPEGRTVGAFGSTIATILVGDIQDYTVLVRRAPSREVQQSVGRVFELLTEEVVRYAGTVKEYQGDAIFAFWEGNLTGQQAVRACRAALALNRMAARLAADPSVWQVPGFPLKMDWALATGPVVIDSVGTVQRAGLSMIGEAVVLAFRLEKFATAETGPILACRMTRDMAAHAFRFRDLGEVRAKGFDRPDCVFALEAATSNEGTLETS